MQSETIKPCQKHHIQKTLLWFPEKKKKEWVSKWKTRFNCHYSYANMTCRGHMSGGVREQTERDKSITMHLTWNTVWFPLIMAHRRLNGVINGFHRTETRPHLESSRVCVSQQAHHSVRNDNLMGTYNHLKGITITAFHWCCAFWGYWNDLF